LSQASAQLAQRFGVKTAIVPISDDRLRTIVATNQGRLAFQDYFVRLRCEPTLQSLEFDGAADAKLAPSVRALLDSADLAGVILCPSNPYLSLAPMLAVAELRERLRISSVPIIAVSPIVAGEALKGPTAKIMRELKVNPSARVIADLYADFVDVVVVDTADAALVAADPRFVVSSTIMKTAEQKAALARYCVALIQSLRQ